MRKLSLRSTSYLWMNDDQLKNTIRRNKKTEIGDRKTDRDRQKYRKTERDRKQRQKERQRDRERQIERQKQIEKHNDKEAERQTD